MKLRQKLAAVLAASLIATSLPVVTMAASDNTITRGIVVQEEDTTVETGLKIEMKDTVDATGAMFFVNLGNAEWKGAASGTIANADLDITYTANGKKELQVTVAAKGADAKSEFVIPVSAELTGGDATISVDGAGSVISDMAPVIFAKTSSAKASVTAEDATNIYKSGYIADVTIEEAIKGSLGTVEDITVSLSNTDYEFVNVTAASNIKLSKGFPVGAAAVLTGTPVTADEFTFTLNQASTVAPGRIVLEDLQIRTKSGKKPVAGDVISVTVSGDKVTKTTVKVATSQEFGNTIAMEDKKVVDMIAGGKEDITFSIKENVDDSIIEGREIEVKLDKGFLSNDVIDTDAEKTALINELYGKVTIGSFVGTNAIESLDLVKDDDDQVTGFTFIIKDILEASENDEIEFADVTVYMPVNESGEVKISAEGRALGTTLETVALNVKAPVEVTSEAYTLKVGLKDQKGGKLVIKETAAGMLQQGENLEITIDKKDKGFLFTDEPVITVDGDLKLDLDNVKVSADGDKITIPVKRESDTASTITITEMEMSVDRTVPEGKYDLKISGAALATDCTLETLKVEDFIVIGTPNTEELAANGLKKGIATFTIGNKNYSMNGATQEMDGTPYISNGRTMVPVRYVANALGVSAKDIYFANGTVTIIAGNKTISLEVGSKVAKLNGVAARVMETATVVKEGRTYVPVSEIGALLGVNASWDGTAKVATFENK